MTTILDRAATKVTHLLSSKLGPEYLYHNLRHTQRVVANAKEIMEAMELNEGQRQKILLAAWFHDTGFIKGAKGHEEKSCEIAREFLKSEGTSKAAIDTVCQLILATKKGHEPINESESILRDADSGHLAKKDYRTVSELLRQELQRDQDIVHTPEEWREINIDMFRSEHRFYTAYARENWQRKKDKNLRRMVKDQKKHKRLIKKEKLKAKLKNQIPDRGVQTLYRTTLRNHIKLSDIADTKSNILLSVNAIIISLALSNLIPKLDNPSNDYLIVPTLIFVVFSIISMILSIRATRPNVTSGTFSEEDVRQKKVNLLFFGNFHKMELDKYEKAISIMLKDKDYIYRSLTKDLYYLGLVLERKYRILRWTYTVFMMGIILSVIAFGIAFHFFGPDRVLEAVVPQ
ncbi:Metal-dependent phosphohydrolase HD sub domain protein [Croceitalea dokdonensis DOKDO 023]|uniref:Metal-dependent phosphohydrolase HD sub domain protein n=1 Tax=Croceitalea dokdonensis DOKDO 023 TaxID=1300341 RepID=A0A0P7AJX7_9FLAO|nr:Pycsar system effector family protein [Croceitalea dokdonensis]KPM32143.1 Metal-dependent phosphohydrolase HD sub domain protein [Croceitalea dokdonensis DOKDO 023]